MEGGRDVVLGGRIWDREWRESWAFLREFRSSWVVVGEGVGVVGSEVEGGSRVVSI